MGFQRGKDNDVEVIDRLAWKTNIYIYIYKEIIAKREDKHKDKWKGSFNLQVLLQTLRGKLKRKGYMLFSTHYCI